MLKKPEVLKVFGYLRDPKSLYFLIQNQIKSVFVAFYSRCFAYCKFVQHTRKCHVFNMPVDPFYRRCF